MGGWSSILERSEKILNNVGSANTSGHGSYATSLSNINGIDDATYNGMINGNLLCNATSEEALETSRLMRAPPLPSNRRRRQLSNLLARQQSRLQCRPSPVVEQAKRISRSLSFILGENPDDEHSGDMEDNPSTQTIMPPLVPEFPPQLMRTATSPHFLGQAICVKEFE